MLFFDRIRVRIRALIFGLNLSTIILSALLAPAAIGLLLIQPGTGLADTTFTVPHGTYTDATNLCSRCHDLHAAPEKNFQDTRKGTFLLKQSDEKAVCYACHDGTASSYNVVAEFGDNFNGTSSRVSSHPIADGTIVCSGCHSPHKEIADGTPGENKVIRLLRGLLPGNIFGFLVESSNTAWYDRAANTALNYPAQQKLANQNDQCGSCHGSGSALPGGDHLTNFNNTPHDSSTSVPGAPAKTTIKCINCHEWHGSDIAPLLETTIGGSPITGNNNTVCISCHLPVSGAYSGDAMYAIVKHSLVVTSTIADTTWTVGNYQPGYCLNCHNPHGSVATDYRRAVNNDLCTGCHDNPAKSIPAAYSYQGITQYSLTPHANAANAATIWPFPAETGQAVGSGGSTGGQCINCHNPHGKNDGSGLPFLKLTMRKEENQCYGGGTSSCHASVTGSQNGINIYQRFTANADNRTHHNVTDADQAAAGSKVECSDCHDTHTNTTLNKNTDPDVGAGNFTTKVNDITLYPQAVLQPRVEGKDNSTDASNPLVNMGNEVNLGVGKQFGAIFRTLIEFDLSQIPADAVVTSAVLSLPEIISGVGFGAITVNVHRNTQPWNELTSNYSNAPVFDPVVSAAVADTQATTWRNWTITSLTQSWLGGSNPNYGVTIKASDAAELGGDNLRLYRSSDYTFPPGQARVARPKLVIQFTSATPPQVNDHITFCGKCHDVAPPADVIMAAGIRRILPEYTDSGVSGEYHGARQSTGPSSGSGLGFADELGGPYYFGTGSMRCSDCHDTHGSSNPFAIKETINGATGITIPFTTIDSTNFTQVQRFCSACHSYTHILISYDCFSCHYHGANADRVGGVPGKTDAYF